MNLKYSMVVEMVTERNNFLGKLGVMKMPASGATPKLARKNRSKFTVKVMAGVYPHIGKTSKPGAGGRRFLIEKKQRISVQNQRRAAHLSF